MQIRAARSDDAADVRRVLRAAFVGHDVGALWDDVTERGHARLSLVATDGDAGDRVIGHVGVSVGWLDSRRALVDLLVLSPLAVAPEHQGRGVGTALLGAAVAAAGETGCPLLVLEGSPGFYGERGFVPGASCGVEPASRRTPSPACQVVAFASYEPWMTGRIVYRDVWWEHDAAGLRDPELAEVELALGAGRSDGGSRLRPGR